MTTDEQYLQMENDETFVYIDNWSGYSHQKLILCVADINEIPRFTLLSKLKKRYVKSGYLSIPLLAEYVIIINDDVAFQNYSGKISSKDFDKIAKKIFP